MATVEILGTVAGVFRTCTACREVKPLEHYLQYRGGWAHGTQVVGNHKVCAACRARVARNAAEYNRTIGAADWGEPK